MTPETFGRIEFITACISLPIALFLSNEWEDGRYYLLIWTLLSVTVAAAARLVPKFEAPDIIRRSANFAAALPLVTSLFIELVHIKNQRGSYIEHPAVNYTWTVVIYTVLSVAAIVLMQLFLKKKKEIALHLPVFILGVSCLSVQLPMTAEYEPDLYESANYGVLISDFLSHGRLPIAEHYGGHMMTGVWEGILYGLINKDTYGAAMSPYSVLITPVIALLFFFLIKEIWNEKIAAAVALLFPFYEWFSYYGLKDERVQPLRDVFMTYELLAYLSVRATQIGMKACEVPVTRAYPKGEKTPTKISFFKGNGLLLKILFKNAFGAYKP